MFFYLIFPPFLYHWNSSMSVQKYAALSTNDIGRLASCYLSLCSQSQTLLLIYSWKISRLETLMYLSGLSSKKWHNHRISYGKNFSNVITKTLSMSLLKTTPKSEA